MRVEWTVSDKATLMLYNKTNYGCDKGLRWD
jgi:hypothetical protein